MFQQPTRKLAVLLHADVVGSTALVQLNETLAHQRIQDTFRTFSEIITHYNGIAHEIRGDALVAEFARASDAVSASLAFQSENAAHNNGLPDEIRPVVRVGISMGEVVVADSTVTGEGVVLAQRLEQLAEPGGVCIQDAAYQTIPKRLPFEYDNLGECELKGFVEPVRVYTVELKSGTEIPKAEAQANRAAVALDLPDKPSIAVLPFTNIGGDPEQEYFSDGITEDIINALSHFRSFPVIARNSTFTYKGRAIRIQEVGKELGARYVLEGSVRKAEERLRITVQLIDAETGQHIWAEKFDTTINNIFDIQDEITQKIIATMEPELAKTEIEKAAVKRAENLTAWDLVLRGTYYVNRYTREEYITAQKLFQSAIDLNPNYSDAWAGLGWSYLRRIEIYDLDKRQELMEKGMRAGKKAVELDDRSSVAHYVLGLSYVWAEQFQAAISEVEIALQLNPFFAQAQRGLGNRLDLIGRNAEGIAQMEQALQLSPRDPNCPKLMGYLCRAYIDRGQPDKALEWIEKAINIRPDNPDLRYRRAVCLAHLDRVEEAKNLLNECERLHPGFLVQREQWRPYDDNERNQRFFAGLVRHRLIPTVSDDE